MNFYHYEGGPISRVDSYGRMPLRGDVRRRIPCPGGCGGQAELETPMTVTRDGVTCEVIPATCKGNCTVDPQTLHHEAETRKEENMKLDEMRARLQSCVDRAGKTKTALSVELGFSRSVIGQFTCGASVSQERIATMMAWCDKFESEERVARAVSEYEPRESEGEKSVVIVPTPEPVAVVHEPARERLERRTRQVETGNAYRAFLEPFLVSAVRDKLATIDPDLADTVEVRVLLEMPA